MNFVLAIFGSSSLVCTHLDKLIVQNFSHRGIVESLSVALLICSCLPLTTSVFAFFAVAFPISGDVASCGIASGPGGGVGYGTCQTLGGLMMTLFPGVTAFSFGILGLYIVAAMLGYDLNNIVKIGKNQDVPIVTYVLGGLGALIVIYYYARGFGWSLCWQRRQFFFFPPSQ